MKLNRERMRHARDRFELACQVLRENQRIQEAAALLCKIMADAMKSTVLLEVQASPEWNTSEEAVQELLAEREDLRPISGAMNRVVRVADQWRSRTEDAWDFAAAEFERRRFGTSRRVREDPEAAAAELESQQFVSAARLKQEAERSVKERIDVEALFRERRSA